MRKIALVMALLTGCFANGAMARPINGDYGKILPKERHFHLRLRIQGVSDLSSMLGGMGSTHVYNDSGDTTPGTAARTTMLGQDIGSYIVLGLGPMSFFSSIPFDYDDSGAIPAGFSSKFWVGGALGSPMLNVNVATLIGADSVAGDPTMYGNLYIGINMGEGITIDLNMGALMNESGMTGIKADMAFALNFGDFMSPVFEMNIDSNGDFTSYVMYMSAGLRLKAGELDFEGGARFPITGAGTNADPATGDPAVIVGFAMTF